MHCECLSPALCALLLNDATQFKHSNSVNNCVFIIPSVTDNIKNTTFTLSTTSWKLDILQFTICILDSCFPTEWKHSNVYYLLCSTVYISICEANGFSTEVATLANNYFASTNEPNSLMRWKVYQPWQWGLISHGLLIVWFTHSHTHTSTHTHT